MLYVIEPTDQNYGPLSNFGQLILLVTFIINILVQLWRERRNRKWQLEDAQRQSDELAAHEETMQRKLDEQTQELATKMRTRVVDFTGRLNHLLDEHNQGRREDDR